LCRRAGTILSTELVAPYIDAILDPAATVLPRLECPALNTTRYAPLRLRDSARPTNSTGPGRSASPQPHIDYFFALDLRNCLPLLPRLLGSIVEAIRFLGADRCALSIVEGNSPDGTADVLAALQPVLDGLDGLAYFYRPSEINPAEGPGRIKKLAQLRNLALEPLLSDAGRARASGNTTVVFANDVAACAEDLLELALQRRGLGADMTCAMDWTYVGRDPTFYDVWVARAINGDSFFEIPSDGNWNSAWNLFWNEPVARARLGDSLPFQVFACWNGATAFGAGPVLDGLRFRSTPRKGEGEGKGGGECSQGEPQLFCKDLWARGAGKIAVVPSVNLEYSDEAAAKIKRLKGYTSDLTRGKTEDGSRIEWQTEPPENVKCMPSWANQFWRPWNEGLEGS
jgi:alpha-1,3-mannosyltransferase